MVTPGEQNPNQLPPEIVVGFVAYNALADNRRLRQDNERMKQELAYLQEEVNIDPLTGLPNQRGFQERFVALTSHHRRRSDVPTGSTAMLDLDRFKAVNDTHGHQAGDDALRRVAKILQSTVRGEIARRSGDEFVAFLPDLRPDLAKLVLERTRAEIEVVNLGSLSNKTGGTSTGITASIGIAGVHSGSANYEIDMSNADRAMYAAKRAGGNRIVIFNPIQHFHRPQ